MQERTVTPLPAYSREITTTRLVGADTVGVDVYRATQGRARLTLASAGCAAWASLTPAECRQVAEALIGAAEAIEAVPTPAERAA